MVSARIRPALVVVDMQNCFAAEGGSFDELGYDISPYRAVVPTVVEAIGRARERGMPVFFSKAMREGSGVDLLDRVHRILPERRLERIKSRPISVRGTWDAELLEEIPVADDDLVVDKRRDSIFQDTEIEMWLRALHVDTLVFCGLDMSICVASSLRDGFNRGWDVVLLQDATGALKQEQKRVLCEIFRDSFGPVVDTDHFFGALRPVDGEDEPVFDLALDKTAATAV